MAAGDSFRHTGPYRVTPHLSYWDKQVGEVLEGTDVSEVSLEVGAVEQAQPRKQERRVDIGLEEESQIVELMHSAGAGATNDVTSGSGE